MPKQLPALRDPREVAVAIPERTKVAEGSPLLHVTVKTAMEPTGITLYVPENSTVEECVAYALELPAKDEATARTQRLIRSELNVRSYDLLAVDGSGRIVRTKAAARVRDVASLKKVRTREGVKQVRSASIDIQGYAPVGTGLR